MSEKDGVAVPMDDYGTVSKNGDKAKLLKATPTTDDPDVSASASATAPSNKGCYFRDGIRRIDFIIVWEEDIEEETRKEAPNGAGPAKTEDHRVRQFRTRFESNLRKVGLEMEEEIELSEKKKIHYIKLFVPWDLMCYYAEDLSLRAPLQVLTHAHPNPADNWSAKVLKMLHIPNLMEQKVPNQPPDYYTCQFRKSKIDRFLGSDNHDTYFTPTQRHQVCYEILATQAYGKRRKAEIGIERLKEDGVYSGAYALHDGPYQFPKEHKDEELNSRQVLYKYWGKWGKWYKYQPLDHIRQYYGEKIGLYFAWLGLYTAWLLPASLIGILVFAYGLITINQNIPGQEVCHSNHSFLMCPLCDENIGCKYWYLSEICIYVKIAYLFDHPGTVFYAIFVSLWAVTFLENWKRKNASLAHHWDVMDYEEEEERPRPEYAALSPTYEKNPVTGVLEPYFPERDRLPRILTGAAVIIIMMVLVIVFIIAVIIYRVLIAIPLFQNPLLRSRALTVASMSAAVVNLVLIMSLGRVYEKLALKLTQWEMHRTQTEFEDQLIFKVFLFQFVNFYSSIIYIAFFKGKFVGYPGHYVKFFGLRNEECNNGGCLVELAQQLAVIMIGKQVINNCQEVLVPKLKTWVHRFTRGLGKPKEEGSDALWAEDYTLIDYEGLFDEYLEMVLQFGFITIFVAAFPLAPLFALLNNWLEIRLDANKLVCETRRPVAERAQDIGVWFQILDVIVQLSVISNAFLIAFTSEFLPRQVYMYQFDKELHGYTNYTLAYAPVNSTHQECRYHGFRDRTGKHTIFFWKLLAARLAFVIVFEHIVFFVARMLDLLIPDVPESLELKIKREQYLAKQALQDSDIVQLPPLPDEAETSQLGERA